MPYTQTDLDNVQTALLRGVRVVRIGDRETQYNSVDDLLKLKKDILSDLSLVTTSGVPRRRTFYGVASKGLG